MRRFLASLCPDNLTPAEPLVATDGRGLFLGVFNPSDPTAVHNCCAYAGWLADRRDTWWQAGTPAPVGSYALLRSCSTSVEAQSDYAGSRTIWIAQTDEVFVASTSQRAIPYFLGSFEPNPRAMAWMLSAGTLGPTTGWDRRARAVGPDGVARLDRTRWTLTVHEPAIEFRVDPVSDRVHSERLWEALDQTLGRLDVGRTKWVLPLSGGFDSRAILLLMKERRGLRTVTWGRKGALDLPGSDAYVARQVATALGVQHSYYTTDLSDEPVDRLLDRFLVAGDGRTSGFLAYMDGFATWKSLYEHGARGIIRGDHGFGPGLAPAFAIPADVVHFNSMTRWRDHETVPPLADFGLPELDDQPWPQDFEKLDTESLEDWRDRLYQLYRIPVYLAGQSDLKAAYVEIASPLLVRDVMQLTRTHPGRLRNGKCLFTRVIAPYELPIRYALDTALVPPKDLMANPLVAEFLCDELGSMRLRQTFTGEFADFLLASFARKSTPSVAKGLLAGPRRRLRLLVPAGMRSRMRSKPKRKSLDLNWVALRAYISSRMLERMSVDARTSNALRTVEAAAPCVAMMSAPMQLSSRFL